APASERAPVRRAGRGRSPTRRRGPGPATARRGPGSPPAYRAARAVQAADRDLEAGDAPGATGPGRGGAQRPGRRGGLSPGADGRRALPDLRPGRGPRCAGRTLKGGDVTWTACRSGCKGCSRAWNRPGPSRAGPRDGGSSSKPSGSRSSKSCSRRGSRPRNWTRPLSDCGRNWPTSSPRPSSWCPGICWGATEVATLAELKTLATNARTELERRRGQRDALQQQAEAARATAEAAEAEAERIGKVRV